MKKTILLFTILLSSLLQAQCFTNLYAGEYQSYGRKSDGSIWGWGDGFEEQFGLGYITGEAIPTLISNATHWQKMFVTADGLFLIKTDGTLWGTGANFMGCVGTGQSNANVLSLTQIGTENNWSQIAGSKSHTIAIKTDGTLWAWGGNYYAQVGGGLPNPVLLPTQLGTATNWVKIASTTGDSSFALKSDGTVWGWGSNIPNIIKEGADALVSTTILHNTATDWAEIWGGGNFIIAKKTNGTLWHWGGGSSGQRGNGTNYDSHIPEQVNADINWAKVALGFRSVMAIKTNGTLWVWGQNSVGDFTLGLGHNNFVDVPTQLGTDTNWADVALGSLHTVAIKTDGSMYAWGLSNNSGQYGNDTFDESPTPIAVPYAGCALSTSSYELPKLQLYPNPATASFSLSYSGTNINTIKILDLTGRVVYYSNPVNTSNLQANINIANLTQGTYLVTLSENDTIIASEKLVKAP
jgi:alpha-tubulin suppressor-like RCC1 family protein